jgi:transposase
MKVQHIVGADLSKKTIDLVCHLCGSHLQIENSPAGFKQMLKWFKQQKIDVSETMIVMEHTGLYSYCFEKYLHQHQLAFTKVNALVIKQSIGMVRGKNDKVDALRIARYGYEKRDKLTADPALSNQLERLQMLHSTRQRLVKHRAALICAIKEYRQIGISDKDIIVQSQLDVIKSFDKQIDKVEAEIEAVVTTEESLQKNYDLLQTIKGVGKEIAMATIVKTHNFTRFTNPRKFACFCGTAPFEHTSGSSIKGRTRVSHLADKHMKTLLEMGSRTAIQYDKELRAFYLRRLEIGKSKTSTLNIVRNKIIYRMFAVVKRQTAFIENYLQAA